MSATCAGMQVENGENPSPTPMPPLDQKRPRDIEGVDAEGAPTKYAKAQLTSYPGDSLVFSAIPTPQSTVKLAKPVDARHDSGSPVDDARECDEAVHVAIRLFKQIYRTYLTDRYVHEKEEEDADERAEKLSSEKCQELRKAFSALLPWAGEMKYVQDATVDNGGYDVVQIKGEDPPTHLDYYNELVRKNEWDDALEIQLDLFRAKGTQARAAEALLALAAAMGSRKEKNWLDQNDAKCDVEEGLKKLGMFKNEDLKRLRRCPKGMQWRRNALRALVREICRVRIYGYYAHYVGCAMHDIRLALARGVSGHVPAAIVVTSQLPLWDAFHFHTDDKNSSPFKGAAKTFEWIKEPGRQFTFQEANPDAKHDNPFLSRQRAKDLQPDEQIRKLLVSSEPVLLLDVVASLAPRDLAKSEGLSKIVKAELSKLFRDAKSRGQAVLLELGSADPHDLAKKVYLPLGAQYGLKCGYIRWRASGEVPWAKEGCWEDRGCVCLQMP